MLANMKTILITGGTGGLGTAVTTHLSNDYRCVVTYHDETEWQTLHDAMPEVTGVKVDVTDEAAMTSAVASIVAEHGELHALVHLVGGFAMSTLAETTVATWQKMLAMNATSAFVAMKSVIPSLRKGGAGRIIAISSAATLDPAEQLGAYAAGKYALNALIDVASKELRGDGITVNALLPTSLDTPAMREFTPREQLVPRDRVAETVAFLLSESAANVTGQKIRLSV
jgi:NAD(P)-dependent dehydrogenase (short-subunit alcohol dehydrogenase family)